MTTYPSTTVRINPKRPLTSGNQSVRRFDGDTWTTETKPAFDARTAFKTIRVVIDAAKVLTAEELL